jgi:drug/metabolite transporter (DMT)-like permease
VQRQAIAEGERNGQTRPAMTSPSTRNDRPLLAIGLMLGAMGILPYLDVVAKHLGQQGMPVFQIVWARMAFGSLMTLPFAVHHAGPAGLVPNRPVYHMIRALFLIGATACFFQALHYLPIADTLSIFFVQPLIITLLSPFVLGEKVGLKRWLAVVTGFIGTLIIIRPGLKELNLGVFLALGAGLSLAIYLLMTRRISGEAHAMVTTFHTSVFGAIGLSIAMLWIWHTPTLSQWGLFALVGLIATSGHYLIVRAYDHAEASLLAPLAYTEMVMATFGGWYFFGDFPDTWTFVGVGVLIACAIYISYAERKSAGDEMRDFEQP